MPGVGSTVATAGAAAAGTAVVVTGTTGAAATALLRRATAVASATPVSVSHFHGRAHRAPSTLASTSPWHCLKRNALSYMPMVPGRQAHNCRTAANQRFVRCARLDQVGEFGSRLGELRTHCLGQIGALKHPGIPRSDVVEPLRDRRVSSMVQHRLDPGDRQW